MTVNRKLISNIIYGVLIVLLLIPQTRVYFLRLISFSPRLESEQAVVQLTDYNWILKGTNADDLDFKTLENKVVFVHFWGTRCPHCIAEMPSIQALYNDYKDLITFVLVTSDSKDNIQVFLDKHNLDMPVYNNHTMPPKVFSTRTIPRTFLLDKQGRIVIDAGRANWNTKKTRKLLDKLLN